MKHLALRSARRSVPRAEGTVAVSFAIACTVWLLPGIVSAVLGAGHEVTRLLEACLPESGRGLLAASASSWCEAKGVPILRWSDAARVDWGTILMFGGGLSLGA